MSGTVYGKVDCRSYTGVTQRFAGEQWKSFWDFMVTLEGVGYVTRIAHNSGTNAVSGAQGNWDEADTFMPGCFGVWKWNTSSVRNFEWYMYAQPTTGSSIQSATSTTPGLVYSQTTIPIQTGIVFSAAICVSGSASFSPWGGTASMGNANKGNPVWVSGANDRTMFVFPRSNAPGGSHSVTRSNMVYLLGNGTQTTTFPQRWHMLADADSFIGINDTSDTAAYSVNFVGPLKLRGSLSGSGIASGSNGFINFCLGTTTSGDTITTNTAIGTVAGNGTSIVEGGLAVGNGAFNVITAKMYTDAASAVFDNFPNSFNGGSYDEFTMTVAASESPHFGIAGYIDSPLIRASWRAQSNSVASDNKRAWFASSFTVTNNRLTTVWSGSAPGTGMSRTGSNIVVPNPR